VEEANGGPTPALVLVHELSHLAAQATLHDHHPATQLPGHKDIIRQYMTKRQNRQNQMRGGGTRWLAARVADPDSNWIRIQSGQWIRIRIRNPDPEGKNYPQKWGKNQKFYVLKCWMLSFKS
jgi:hypothetical protein